jgi:hypothetical protein
LFIQFWSSNIRERQSEWRTATLEVQAKRADADLERAKADIANADARAAEATASALQAQAELERFKATRLISESDKPGMIAALSKFAGTTAAIYILGEGPEPQAFAASIRELLERSQWSALSWNWSGVGGAAGVIVLFKPGSEAETGSACDALVRVLTSAHIVSAKQPWPGDWDHFGGMLNGPNPPSPTEAPIRIVVGSKPQ